MDMDDEPGPDVCITAASPITLETAIQGATHTPAPEVEQPSNPVHVVIGADPHKKCVVMALGPVRLELEANQAIEFAAEVCRKAMLAATGHQQASPQLVRAVQLPPGVDLRRL